MSQAQTYMPGLYLIDSEVDNFLRRELRVNRFKFYYYLILWAMMGIDFEVRHVNKTRILRQTEKVRIQ